MPKREAPDRKDSKRTKAGDADEGSSVPKVRQRIQRACDRCKLKKSKCDGEVRCQNCVTSGSECRYSVRRRREAREWYWNMHEIIDEALQRLYWACREKADFPGVLPDESTGEVSTEDILLGLGLIGANMGTEAEAGSRRPSVQGMQSQRRTLNPPDMVPIMSSPSASPSGAGGPGASGDGTEGRSLVVIGKRRERGLDGDTSDLEIARSQLQSQLTPFGPEEGWNALVGASQKPRDFEAVIDPDIQNMQMPMDSHRSDVHMGYMDSMADASSQGQYLSSDIDWIAAQGLHPPSLPHAPDEAGGEAMDHWSGEMAALQPDRSSTRGRRQRG